MLVSPAYDIYRKSLIKHNLSSYLSDPKSEYLLQHEIFVSIFAARKKLLIPILMGGARSRYQKTIDNLNEAMKDRFRESDGGVFSASPYWGGIAELCLHVASIEQNQPYTLLPPEDPLLAKLNIIAVAKLKEANQKLQLPQRLLLGVDERYFLFVNKIYNQVLADED